MVHRQSLARLRHSRRNCENHFEDHVVRFLPDRKSGCSKRKPSISFRTWMEHQLRAELGASRITASRAESAKTHKKVLQSEKKGSLRRACAGGSTGLNCLAGASHRLAALPEVRARCTRRGDILRTGVLKNFLRALSPVRIVGVHGKENTALLHASLVAFRSLLRTPMPTRAPAIPPTAPSTPAPARAAMMGPAAMKGPSPGMRGAPIPASQPNPPLRMRADSCCGWTSISLVTFIRASALCCFGFNRSLLVLRAHRALPGHHAVLGDDFHIVAVG